jgi:hypothetical protein
MMMMTSASVMIAVGPSRDMEVQVVRVLEVTVDMVMFGMNTM